MAFVKTKDIPFNERYVSLPIENHSIEDMTENLRLLYNFIDNNAPGNSIYKNGNAYRWILKKARYRAGNHKHIISKKQVAALIGENRGYGNRTKIPYTSGYIFEAIFQIFDELRNDTTIEIPQKLVLLYGNTRREVFYRVQSNEYNYRYTHNNLDERCELAKIRKSLLNDLCANNSALGKRYQ